MSQDPQEFLEQLSAFMDGELPDAEARFLLRRLEHDAELRAAWTRMQLASQCLRAQAWRPMDAAFPGRVAASVAEEVATMQRRPWLRWAVAASVLALGLLMAPHLRQAPSATAPAALADAPAGDHLVASPASADLVALRPAARAAGALVTPEATARSEGAPLVAAVEPSDRASPLPLDGAAATESPTEFPLVDTGEQRSWPRSEVVNASSDPSIEAYLVRHNQMIAEDGLGGFVPYVDVVSNSQPAANADAASAAEANAQESDGQ